MSDPSDPRRRARLILRAQAGDRPAFEELLVSFQGSLFSYLTSLVRDRHLAEDVLQEVFVIVYRKLKWLRDPELFRPWLHRIATREAFHALRKSRRGPPSVAEDVLPEVAEPVQEEPPDPELLARLPELVEDVSPASRAVLLMHYEQQMTLVEIAQALGLSVGTVKSRLHYGLQLLRKRLGVESSAG
jgi:RNA polymerase sigma-70 factor (ECF subfamily)